MTKLKSFLLVACAAALVSSCSLDSHDKNIIRTTYNYDQCFNAVTDMATGAVTTFTGVNYSLVLQNDKEASLLINSLMLAAGESPVQLKLTGLRWSLADNQWQVVTVSNPKCSNDKYEITDLSVKQLLRKDRVGGPVYDISFRVNGRYAVCALPLSMKYYGTTDVIDDVMPQPFSFERTTYTLTFNPHASTADVLLGQAKFAENMPPMDIQMKALPVSFNKAGFSFSTPEGEKVTPYMGDVPMPAYPISDIKWNSTMFDPGTLLFSVTPGSMGFFNVTATLTYTSPVVNPI